MIEIFPTCFFQATVVMLLLYLHYFTYCLVKIFSYYCWHHSTIPSCCFYTYCLYCCIFCITVNTKIISNYSSCYHNSSKLSLLQFMWIIKVVLSYQINFAIFWDHDINKSSTCLVGCKYIQDSLALLAEPSLCCSKPLSSGL